MHKIGRRRAAVSVAVFSRFAIYANVVRRMRLGYNRSMTIAELFESLAADSIERFIAVGQEEHFSLDFKTVSGADLKSGSDKKNLAEVLSGFANSAGGIAIWGVATRRDAAGLDIASEIKPISPIQTFVTRLREASVLAVTPEIIGVRHRSIALGGGESGVAATYVPESERGPHMALNGHDRCFKRAQDRFYRMAPYDIADMLGRRQRPALDIAYFLQKTSTYWQNVTHAEIQITLTLINHGRASASLPYVRIQANRPFMISPLGVSAQQAGAPLEMTAETAEPPAYSLAARAGFVVHPKASFQIARLSAVFRADNDVVPCVINYSTAALDSPIVENRIEISAPEIAVALDRPVEAYER